MYLLWRAALMDPGSSRTRPIQTKPPAGCEDAPMKMCGLQLSTTSRSKHCGSATTRRLFDHHCPAQHVCEKCACFALFLNCSVTDSLCCLHYL